VRVATFNVQHGRRATGGPASADEFAAAIAQLDADVLALQEVDRGVGRSGRLDLLAIAAEAMGATASAWGRTLRFWRGQYGNALLVRGVLDAAAPFQFSTRAGRELRGAIFGEVTSGGQTMSVAATHLDIDRAEAEVQLAVVSLIMLEFPAPHVLLGDLNLSAPQVPPPLTLLAGPDTHPAEDPQRRIDHIAVSGFSPTDSTTVRTPISDHRAVVADLVLPR
jgi:endonuclease/exonuclease/phosphatase family metal-dependent hydrolase